MRADPSASLLRRLLREAVGLVSTPLAALGRTALGVSRSVVLGGGCHANPSRRGRNPTRIA